MALTIENLEYTDLCGKYIYGSNILDFSDNILESINDFMEQVREIDWNIYNPDNFYSTLTTMSKKEVEEAYDLDLESEDLLYDLSEKVGYLFGYDKKQEVFVFIEY